MKAKIFNFDSGPEIDEDEINQWLENNAGITMQNIVFTANDNRFILVIFYTENKL